MYPNQEPQMSIFEQGRMVLKCGQLFIQCWARMIYPFTRRAFGRNHFGLLGLLGFVVFWMYGLATSPADLSLFTLYTILWFLAIVLHMPGTAQQDDDPSHSHYNGWPMVCDWLPVGETTAKEIVEPLVVGVVGFLVTLISPGLGVFIIIGGIMGSFENTIIGCKIRNKVRKMRKLERRKAWEVKDAELENETLMEEYDRRY